MIVDEAALIRPGRGDRRPEDRPWTRLLHRFRIRDPSTGAASLGSDLLRRPLRQPRLAGQPKVPGRRPVHRPEPSRVVHAALRRSARQRVCPASVLVAVWNEQDRPPRTSSRTRCAPAASPRTSRPPRPNSVSRSNMPTSSASRMCGSYGATDGDDTASDEVKNIVTGDQQPTDPKSWQPDTCMPGKPL